MHNFWVSQWCTICHRLIWVPFRHFLLHGKGIPVPIFQQRKYVWWILHAGCKNLCYGWEFKTKVKVLKIIFINRCNSMNPWHLKTMKNNVSKTFEKGFENQMTITGHFIVAIPFTRMSKRQWLLFFYVFINIMM